MTDRTLLAQALAALEDGTFDRAHWITALRSALAAPQPEPVALESVHLTRDTQGMCVVRVNGRVAIRDNGDIIDHMATLEWFATPPAAPAEPCYCDRMGIGVPGVSCGDCPRDYKPAAPAPDVPMTDEQFADMVADASLAVDLAANPLKLLAFARAVLSAAPAVLDGAVPPGSWEHLKVMMQHSAWEGTLQLCDALANIEDFAKSAAPAVREPQDERAAFEAWHSEYRGLVPLRRDDSYFDTHARLRWEGWQARAHGIGGGGNHG